MIGYKIATHGTTRVVITLEIPEDAQTNMSRSSVAVRETAKHRTNKAKVLAIEDASGVSYTSATSSNYYKKPLTYTVGETIEEHSYDADPEKVCAGGIHYFLSRRVAELYGLEKVANGLYQSWHDNGQKEMEVTYVDGKRHGLYQTWHFNGQKEIEMTHLDGECHWHYQHWHKNGQKFIETTYVKGKCHGLYQSWHSNGQKLIEATYVNGKYHGLYQSWHSNGQKEAEATFVNGVPHGLCKSWKEDGTILEEAIYENGVKV